MTPVTRPIIRSKDIEITVIQKLKDTQLLRQTDILVCTLLLNAASFLQDLHTNISFPITVLEISLKSLPDI